MADRQRLRAVAGKVHLANSGQCCGTGLLGVNHRRSPSDPTPVPPRITEYAAHALDSNEKFATLVNIAPIHVSCRSHGEMASAGDRMQLLTSNGPIQTGA